MIIWNLSYVHESPSAIEELVSSKIFSSESWYKGKWLNLCFTRNFFGMWRSICKDQGVTKLLIWRIGTSDMWRWTMNPPWDTSCNQSVYLKLQRASFTGFLCLRELSWDLRRLREPQRKQCSGEHGCRPTYNCIFPLSMGGGGNKSKSCLTIHTPAWRFWGFKGHLPPSLQLVMKTQDFKTVSHL